MSAGVAAAGPRQAPGERPAAGRTGPSATGNEGVAGGGSAPLAARPAPARAEGSRSRSGAFTGGTVVPMGPGGWEARAEGVAWDEGRIVRVGTAAEVRQEAARRGIPVQDLGGRWVLPGFVDAHMHFLHAGVKTMRPDLRGATSRKEALARVASWLAAHPGPGPVIAEGWDESGWPDRARPTRDEVDAVVAAAAREGAGPLDRPVVLRRICGHVAVAGSGALPLVRARWDDDGHVDLRTGLLLEEPSLYLNEVLPSTAAQLDRAVDLACAEAHRLGVTALGDYSQAPYRAALRRAAAQGRLTVRVASSVYAQQREEELAAGFRTGRPEPGAAGAWMQDGALKLFLDGSLGGHTAYLREPYLDWKPGASAGKGAQDPHAGHGHGDGASAGGPRGTRIWTDEELDGHLGAAQAAGVQVHAHAIGDAAIDQALAAFGRLAARADLEGKGWGHNALRHRIEHFEIAHDDQMARAAALGLVSSSQPNFVGEWSAKGGMYHARLGDRFLLNNRFRRFKEEGLLLAFGSDGMPFGPLVGLRSAAAHPDPSQRLPPLEAAWHYTWMAAWSLHLDGRGLGHLAEGHPADLVVLDVPDPSDASGWKVSQTLVDGAVRFQA